MLLFQFIPVISCAQVFVELPQTTAPGVSFSLFKNRAKAPLTGGHATCFLMKMNIQSKDFLLMVDTGSTDTAIPRTGLNSYSGPTISYTIPSSAEPLSSFYGDGSFWQGYEARMSIRLTGTNVTAVVPLIAMTFQSTGPLFSDGVNYQGLMGIAFPNLAKISNEPRSVMDALVASRAIPKNQVAFHGCPYSMSSNSWIDIGNETPFTGCGDTPVKIFLKQKLYYNVEVDQFLVNDSSIALPSGFQSSMSSILDSCTSNMILPTQVLASLQSAIIESGGLSTWFRESIYLDSFLRAEIKIGLPDDHFDFTKLPTLTTIINDGRDPDLKVKLVLGPRQYIQKDNTGFYFFMVTSHTASYAILGLPIFSAYHIVLDRDEGSVTFRQGCYCNVSLDQYPQIHTLDNRFRTSSTLTSHISSTSSLMVISTSSSSRMSSTLSMSSSTRLSSTTQDTSSSSRTTSTHSTISTFRSSTSQTSASSSRITSSVASSMRSSSEVRTSTFIATNTHNATSNTRASSTQAITATQTSTTSSASTHLRPTTTRTSSAIPPKMNKFLLLFLLLL